MSSSHLKYVQISYFYVLHTLSISCLRLGGIDHTFLNYKVTHRSPNPFLLFCCFCSQSFSFSFYLSAMPVGQRSDLFLIPDDLKIGIGNSSSYMSSGWASWLCPSEQGGEWLLLSHSMRHQKKKKNRTHLFCINPWDVGILEFFLGNTPTCT